MSGERASGAQSVVNALIERFDLREDEAPSIHFNGRLEDQPQRGSLNPIILADTTGRWKSPESFAEQAAFNDIGIPGSGMTLAPFVETKFVPEHVQYKKPAGQTHYQMILKHVISPEAVSKIFDPEKSAKMRLTAVQDWPYLDSVRLCDLRPEHIRRIVSAADNAGYSAQTVKHIKNVCFAIIAHAQKEGCFSGPNPASLVKLPKTMRSPAPGLSLEQARDILDLLQHPYREVVLFALTTGLSLPEICDLRWKNLNLDDFEHFTDGQAIPARTVLVKSWWNRSGLGDSRTCHKNKFLEIREPLLSALRELRKGNSREDADDCVLTSADGNRIIPTSFRVGEMKRVAKALGLASLSWRDLRRTHQAFQAQLLSQQSLSVPLRTANILSNWPSMDALFRYDSLYEDNNFRSYSSSHRTFCFGRRLRAGSEADVSLDNPRGRSTTR